MALFFELKSAQSQNFGAFQPSDAPPLPESLDPQPVILIAISGALRSHKSDNPLQTSNDSTTLRALY